MARRYADIAPGDVLPWSGNPQSASLHGHARRLGGFAFTTRIVGVSARRMIGRSASICRTAIVISGCTARSASRCRRANSAACVTYQLLSYYGAGGVTDRTIDCARIESGRHMAWAASRVRPCARTVAGLIIFDPFLDAPPANIGIG